MRGLNRQRSALIVGEVFAEVVLLSKLDLTLGSGSVIRKARSLGASDWNLREGFCESI
jgi:hypothetical protein